MKMVKVKLKCVKCNTIYDHKDMVCPKCGCPLGEGIECGEVLLLREADRH